MIRNDIEHACLEKLNSILNRYGLKISKMVIKSCRETQYRLTDIDNAWADKTKWYVRWQNIHDMLIADDDSSLLSYGQTLFNMFTSADNETKTLFWQESRKLVAAYDEVLRHLKVDSLEEFLIRCDLIGVVFT